MESNTLSSVVDGTCARIEATRVAASPILAACCLEVPGRIRTAPTMPSRSQGGVGSYGVAGMWQLDRQFDQDPKFFTHNTTRQGPPTCSPPV